jgi:DNA-binding PadR family transcriptional regulator
MYKTYVKYVLKKGSTIMKELTVLEQIILVSIVNLSDEAYGVVIRKKIREMTGKNLMYGTLYNALDQLLRKKYIQKIKGKPAEGRGAHGRVYYALAPFGQKALAATYKLQKTVWDHIPDLVKDYES